MPSAGPRNAWFVIALVLLTGLTAFTRLAAPGQTTVTNDEMHHLESWRNRYRTDDAYPLFLERLEVSGRLSEKRLELVQKAYHASPLVQRAFIVLVDPQPPGFPIMAEIIEATTRSSLLALRIPSVIASILAVWLMYRLGRALRDPTLGLWLAALLAIGFLTQVYAGIGRPYAIAQFATILLVYVFVREQQAGHASPRRLWWAALVAQLTQWMTWAIAGMLVLLELVRRFRAASPVGTLVRQTWWYAVISAVVLPVMAIQLQNETVSSRAGVMSPLAIWYHISLASPFALVDPLLSTGPESPLTPGFTLAPFSVAGFVLLALAFLGIGAVVGDASFGGDAPLAGGDGSGVDDGAQPAALALPRVRWGLVAALAVSLGAQIAIGSGTRFMMTYIVMPTIFAGIGAHWILRKERISQIAVTVLLVGFGVISILRPEDPYDRVFWGDTDYRAPAARVAEVLEPGDVWCSFPYFQANNLYRYAELPEPVLPISWEELTAFMGTLPREDVAVVFYGREEVVEQFRVLRRAPERWDFFNRHVVVRVPPRPRRGR